MSINAKLAAHESQQFRFINKTQQTTNIGNGLIAFEDMLYADYFIFSDVKDLVYIPFCNKIQVGDDAFIQFETSYPSYILTLVKINPYTETAYNGSETLIKTYTDIQGDTIYVYNIPINDASLSGEYYFKIKGYSAGLPEVDFWSEPFEVQTNFEETLLIKWGGNSTFNDGITWSTSAYTIDAYQQLRIEARLLSPTYNPGQNTYEDSDSELTTLRAYPTATHVLDIKRIPFYVYEKIALALAHDEFLINDKLYNTAEDFELSDYKQQLSFSGSIPLRLVEYQNKTVMPILTGEIPVFPSSYLLINATDVVLINATDKLLKS